MIKRLQNLKTHRERNDEDGFSMIELVVSMVILAIVVAIAIPIYSNQVKQGIIASLKSDVTQTAGQVGVKAGTADEDKVYTYDPCSDPDFDTKIAVKSEPEVTIDCQYYGSSVSNTQTEKKMAYDMYEWCVQGTNSDIDETWHFNSRNQSLGEGPCTMVGTVLADEAIG